MRDDSILSLSEYKELLMGMEYEESEVNKIMNLKIKHSVLGILSKDNKPASPRKLTVSDLLDHLNRCVSLF